MTAIPKLQGIYPCFVLLVLAAQGLCAEETGNKKMGGEAANGEVIISPNIEAIEISHLGGSSHLKVTRSHNIKKGSATIAASYYTVVPWQWGEREIKALAKPNFSLEEGEAIPAGKGGVDEELWEEVPRTQYPCLELGTKVMVFRKIFSAAAPRGVVTTIFSFRQPTRGGKTAVIAEEGEGDRFVSQICSRGEDAVVVCGEAEAAKSVQGESYGLERRWRLAPGGFVDIYNFGLQGGGYLQ
jgi:hypothetical protein